MCETKTRLEHCIALRDDDGRMDLQNGTSRTRFRRRLGEKKVVMTTGYQRHYKKVVCGSKLKERPEGSMGDGVADWLIG